MLAVALMGKRKSVRLLPANFDVKQLIATQEKIIVVCEVVLCLC